MTIQALAGVVEAAEELRRLAIDRLHISHHPPDGNGRLVFQKG